MGQRRRGRPSGGSKTSQVLGAAQRDLTATPFGQTYVAHVDSLEEITHWLGTFRERLRQARASERAEIAAVVDRLEDQYMLRRAELS